MFTGLIATLGTVRAVVPRRHGRRLVMTVPRLPAHVHCGDSLAVAGVCLSVVARQAQTVAFDLVAETLRRTTLGRLSTGDSLNVEQPLRARDRVHGHLVLGHVDATARVAAVAATGRDRWIELAVPQRLLRYCVPKGSLAVDGVSLTIGRVRGRRVRLYLIPTTLRKTTLGRLRTGDRVNLEVDWLAKLALRQRARR